MRTPACNASSAGADTRQPEEAGHQRSEPHLVFDLGERRFSIPAAAVRQVAEMPAVLRVPGGPPPYSGIVVLRGQLITVLELRLLLAADDEQVSARRCLVVLEARSGQPLAGPLGLVVDAVRGVTSGTATAGTPLDLAKLLGSKIPDRS